MEKVPQDPASHRNAAHCVVPALIQHAARFERRRPPAWTASVHFNLFRHTTLLLFPSADCRRVGREGRGRRGPSASCLFGRLRRGDWPVVCAPCGVFVMWAVTTMFSHHRAKPLPPSLPCPVDAIRAVGRASRGEEAGSRSEAPASSAPTQLDGRARAGRGGRPSRRNRIRNLARLDDVVGRGATTAADLKPARVSVPTQE